MATAKSTVNAWLASMAGADEDVAALDDDGVCSLVHDDAQVGGIGIIVEAAEEEATVYALLGALPEDEPEANRVLAAAMSANMSGPKLVGGALALEPERGLLVLRCSVPIEGSDPDAFRLTLAAAGRAAAELRAAFALDRPEDDAPRAVVAIPA